MAQPKPIQFHMSTHRPCREDEHGSCDAALSLVDQVTGDRSVAVCNCQCHFARFDELLVERIARSPWTLSRD